MGADYFEVSGSPPFSLHTSNRMPRLLQVLRTSFFLMSPKQSRPSLLSRRVRAERATA